MNLSQHNSLGLPARADRIITVHSPDELPAITNDLGQQPRFILGGGSNVVIRAPISACVLLNECKGKSIDTNGRLTAASGESWHDLVMWSLDQGYAGLENLALIPGTVGAAPVQNIGAYGVELKDIFVALTAWDFVEKKFRTFTKADCQFGYRDSIFKHADIQGPWNAPRYFITDVVLQLAPMGTATLSTNYADLNAELAALGNKVTARDVAHAVIQVRQRKLPDPKLLGNVGSFFKNPIISNVQAKHLKLLHPNLPQYPVSDTQDDVCKISAAWLIDRCGFKGARRGDVGVHADHALVLVNYGGGSGRELLALASEIQQAVVAKFGVFLEPEPIIVP
ncbi:UDP-N-acetylmuramate dehydrogenase [beta proteobacterium MWH-UniP1]